MSYSLSETFNPNKNSKNVLLGLGIFLPLFYGLIIFDSYSTISAKILDPIVNYTLLFAASCIFLGSFYFVLKSKNGAWLNGFTKVNVDEEGNFHLMSFNRPDVKFSVGEIKKIKIHKNYCKIHLKNFSYVVLPDLKLVVSQKIIEHPRLANLSQRVNVYKEFFNVLTKTFLFVVPFSILVYFLIKISPSSWDNYVILFLFGFVLSAVALWFSSRNKVFNLQENGLLTSLMLALMLSINAESAFSNDDLKFEEIAALNSQKKYDDSFTIAKTLYAKYPDKSTVNQIYAFLLLKQNSAHADQVIAILEKYPEEAKANQIIACAYAEKQEWEKAIAFAQSEEFPKDSKRIKEHQACRVFAKEEVQLSSEAK